MMVMLIGLQVMLCNAGGDILSDPETRLELPILKAGEETNISVQLRAPECSGRFVSYFSAKTAEGQGFGQRLWSSVVVSEDAIQYSILERTDSIEMPATIELSVNTSLKDDITTHYVVGDAKIIDIVEDSLNTPLTQSTNSQHTTAVPATEEPTPTSNTSACPAGETGSTTAPRVDTSYSWCASSRDGNSTLDVTVNAIVDATVDNAAEDDEAKLWEKELTLLREMGFSDEEDIIDLLIEHCKAPAVQQDGVPDQNGLMLVVGRLIQLQSNM